MNEHIMKTLMATVSGVALLGSANAFGAQDQSAGGEQMIFKCKNEVGAFVYQGTPCPKTYSAISSWKAEIEQKSPEPPVNGPVSFTIPLSPKGQYKTEGSVNSIPLLFQVDTGANTVAIPKDIAEQAGMSCKARARIDTPNGQVSECVSVIDKMTFGIFTVKKVAALIMPNLKQPLLGMNVLRLFRIEHDEGVMRISYKHAIALAKQRNDR